DRAGAVSLDPSRSRVASSGERCPWMLFTKMNVLSPVPARLWADLAARDPYALPEHRIEWIQALSASRRYLDASRFYEFPGGAQFLLPLARRTGAGGVGGQLQSYPRSWGMGGVVGPDLEAPHAAMILKDLRSLGMQRVSIHPDPMKWDPWMYAAACVGAT